MYKSYAYTGALSCIHVFNSRSSLRKPLFKTQVVDSISHPRATAHDSSNGTRNRIRFGTFDKSTEAEPAEVFSLTRKLAAPLCASFLMGHMVASLARSSSLFFVEDRFQFFLRRTKQLEETKTFLRFVSVLTFVY